MRPMRLIVRKYFENESLFSLFCIRMIEIPEKEREKPDDTIQSRIYRSKYSGSQNESRIPL